MTPITYQIIYGYMTQLDADSQEIIRAIDHHGGSAMTTEIRRETGLDNSSVRYRYDKLEDAGLIDTKRDPDQTPEGVAPVTVATLTTKGREEIEKGLTFEQEVKRAEIEPQDNAERIAKLESEVVELRDLVRTLQENQNWIGPQVEKLVTGSCEMERE